MWVDCQWMVAWSVPVQRVVSVRQGLSVSDQTNATITGTRTNNSSFVLIFLPNCQIGGSHDEF